MKFIGFTVARLVLVYAVVSLALTFPCPLQAIKGEDLVLYLSLDEGQGGVAEDLSGNSNTGELMGDPGWIPDGKYESAISFDGADDHIIAPDSGFSTMGAKGDSYTVQFWIKTTQLSNDPLWWQSPAIMSKRGLASKFRVFTIYLTPDGALGIHFEAPQEEVVSESAVSNDEWRHVAFARSGGEVYVYVDGKLESKSSITDNDKSAPEESVVIGARLLDTGAMSRFFQGSLDEIAIYHKALTEAQIKQDMLNTVLKVYSAGRLTTIWAGIKVQD